MEAVFKASIKEFNSKLLVSGDQSSRITLEADNLPTDIKNKINALQDDLLNKAQGIECVLIVR